MSGTGRKSEPPPASPSEALHPPAASRPGFVTMPTELRLFQGPDPTAMKLEDMPGAVDAAEKLRELGRGSDVLYENLRAEAPPREPSANDNRAEHVIVQVPAGASPWGKNAAAAKDVAATAIDEDALPSASVPSSRPPPSVLPARSASPSTKREAGERGRRWVPALVAFSVAAVLVVVLLRRWQTLPESNPSAAVDPSATGSQVQAMGTLVAMPTGAPTATGAPLLTSTASGEPSAAGAAHIPAASTATITRPTPKPTGEPHADAGTSQNATGTAGPIAPAVAPVVTVAPKTSSTAPSASSAAATGTSSLPSPKPTY